MKATQRAFPIHATPERYFPAAGIEAARQRVESCLARGDGPALVIGASGLGKSMLCEVLALAIQQDLRVVKITSAQLCTRRALLQSILFALDLPYRDRDEGELRLSLTQALSDAQSNPRGVALLIDEAQTLAPRLLEELRVLSNFARGGEPLVRLALFGGPALEDLFASPEMESFNQRLGARCYLSAMTYEETRDYARSHVAAAGGDADSVFTPDGLDAVFHASDGVPRLINQVCDRALMTAVADSHGVIDAQVVQAAWSDLHQLPAPWHTPEPANRQDAPTFETENVVEFGALEDEPSTTIVEPEKPKATPAPVWNADESLLTLAEESGEEESPATADTPDEDDLFGGGFAEEEIVIDKFALLETVLRPNAPQVINLHDEELGKMLGTLLPLDDESLPEEDEPACQEVKEEQEAFEEADAYELDAPSEAPSLRLQSADDDDLSCSSDDALEISQKPLAATLGDEERDILVIEQDLVEIEGLVRPGVERREYRQLFAQLRKG